MDRLFVFQVTSLDPDACRDQVSLALKQRTELLSRQKYPRLWRMSDNLSRKGKAPPAVLRRRRKLRVILGLVNWTMGLFLMLPGLMDPAALFVPLLVGSLCFGFSAGILWRNARRLLGILSVLFGAVLCLGGLCSLAELGRFLPLGVLCLAVGVAALGPLKQARASVFDRAADRLLKERAAPSGNEDIRVAFSEEGMSIGLENEGPADRLFPYSSFEFVLETEDLLLPICDDSIMVLQKKDQLTGTVPELAEFLGKRTQYVCIKALADSRKMDDT